MDRLIKIDTFSAVIKEISNTPQNPIYKFDRIISVSGKEPPEKYGEERCLENWFLKGKSIEGEDTDWPRFGGRRRDGGNEEGGGGRRS